MILQRWVYSENKREGNSVNSLNINTDHATVKKLNYLAGD